MMMGHSHGPPPCQRASAAVKSRHVRRSGGRCEGGPRSVPATSCKLRVLVGGASRGVYFRIWALVGALRSGLQVNSSSYVLTPSLLQLLSAAPITAGDLAAATAATACSGINSTTRTGTGGVHARRSRRGAMPCLQLKTGRPLPFLRSRHARTTHRTHARRHESRSARAAAATAAATGRQQAHARRRPHAPRPLAQHRRQ